MPKTNPSEFIATNYPYAKQVQDTYGIPASVSLAQAALESNWGVSAPHGNYFGIKDTSKDASNVQSTQEFNPDTGKMETQNAAFRSYDNAQQSFMDYGDFLHKNSRYATALQHKDNPEQFIDEVAKAGYATDPNYATKVKSIAKQIEGSIGADASGNVPKSGPVVLPPSAYEALKTMGHDPDKFMSKINADINKGGDSKWDAYKAYYSLIDKTSSPSQQSLRAFVSNDTGKPMNETQLSWWDDTANSFLNALRNSWTHTKEAVQGAERGVGITSKEEFGQNIDALLQEQARQTLKISPDASKDAFNNWRSFGSGLGAGLGQMTGVMVPAVASLGADLLTGNPLPTLAVMGSSGLIGALDMYGYTFEEGKKRGLSNDQAATLGASVGLPTGALFMLPAHTLTSKLMQPLVRTMVDEAITNVVDKGLTKAAFDSAMKQTSNGIADFMAKRGANYLVNAGEQAISGGGTMAAIHALDNFGKRMYANYTGTEGNFQDVLHKTNRQEFTEALESGAMGGIIGGILALPSLAKPALSETMYGYVDKYANDPNKIGNLKNFINQIAEQNQYTPEKTATVMSMVDDMQKTAQTYGASVKDPDARFQLYQLLQQKNLNEGSKADVVKAVENLSTMDEAFAKPIKDLWAQVDELYNEKAKTIDNFMSDIGKERKPIDYAEYTNKAKVINNKIADLLHQIYPESKPEDNAIQIQETTSGLLRDQGIREQGGLRGVEQQDQSEQTTQEGQKEKVGPTISELIDIPMTLSGIKGFMHINEDGGLDFIGSENGKIFKILDKDGIEGVLKEPVDNIKHLIDDYDTGIFEHQKASKTIQNEKDQAKEAQGRQEEVLKTEQPTATETPEQSTAATAEDGVSEITSELQKAHADNLGADAEQLTQMPDDKFEQVKKDNEGLPEGDVYTDEIKVADEAKKIVADELNNVEKELTDEDKGTIDSIGTALEDAGLTGEGENGKVAETPETGTDGTPDNKPAGETEQGINGQTGSGESENKPQTSGGTDTHKNTEATAKKSAEKPSQDLTEDQIQRIKDVRRWSKLEFNTRRGENLSTEEYSKLRSTRLQKEGGNSVSEKTAKLVNRVLNRAFPGIKTEFLGGEDFFAKHGRDALGATNPDGTVDINLSRVTGETQVHEFGHIWNTWAKKFAPEIYNRGLELVAQDKELLDRVKENYPELEGHDLHEEAMATLIGEKGAAHVEGMDTSLTGQVKQFLDALWNKLKDFISKRLGVKDNRFDGIENMSMNDFAAKVAKELLSNREIDPITSSEISAIEGDGMSRFQWNPHTGRDETFETPASMFTVSLGQQSGLLASSRNLKAIKDIVGTATALTEDHITDIVDHFTNQIKNTIPKLFKNPDGTTNVKAGSEYLENLSLNTGTKEFRNAIKSIAEEAMNPANGTKFDPNALPEDARKIYKSLGKFEVQRDQRENIDGNIIVAPMTVLADANTAKAMTETPVRQFHDKWNAIKAKNPVMKFVGDKMEYYFQLTAHFPLFTKLMSPEAGSMWSKLSRGMQEAPGKKFRIQQNAEKALKPLLDLFGNGSEVMVGKNMFPLLMIRKPLGKTEGIMAQEFFNDTGKPNVKITQAELLTHFNTLQAEGMKERHFGEGKSGVVKFHLPEYEGERKGQTIEYSERDWQKILDYFAPNLETISKAYTQTGNILYEAENPVFLTMNGTQLAKVEPKEDGMNYYAPIIHGEGRDAIKDYIRNNSFIDDVNSHKTRAPKDNDIYYGGDAFGVIRGRIENGSHYAAYTFPLHNGDTMMDYVGSYLKESDGKNYIEWFNKFKHHLNNPEEDIGKTEKALFKGFTMAAIGLNPFIDLKHLSTIPLASNVIRSKYLLSSLAALPKSYADLVKNFDVFAGDNKNYSPILQEMMEDDFANMRIHTNTSEMQAMVSDGYVVNTESTVNGIKHKVKLTGKDALIFLKTMETSTGAVIWEAAKKQVDAEMPHLQKDTKEYKQAVGQLYMDAIVGAQPSFDAVHSSFFSKGGYAAQKGPLKRALSLFGGQMFAQWNMFAERAVMATNEPSKINNAMLAKAFMNVFAINALMVGTIDTLRQTAMGSSTQKDNQYWNNVMLESVRGFPILGQIVQQIIEKEEKGIWASDLSLPVFDTINKGTKLAADAMKGKEDLFMKEGMQFGSQILGIPSFPIRTAKKLVTQ